jgi:hypothetical protein
VQHCGYAVDREPSAFAVAAAPSGKSPFEPSDFWYCQFAKNDFSSYTKSKIWHQVCMTACRVKFLSPGVPHNFANISSMT